MISALINIKNISSVLNIFWFHKNRFDDFDFALHSGKLFAADMEISEIVSFISNLKS